MAGDIVMDFLEEANDNDNIKEKTKKLENKLVKKNFENQDVIEENNELKIEESDSELNTSTENNRHVSKNFSVVSEYTVKNIPETLTILTLLRQFLKPKIHGPLISRADIDMESMAPFIEQDLSKLILYMQVPLSDKER